MEMGIRLYQIRDSGRRDSDRWFHTHWPHIDTEAWPGRELEWAYCHPVLTAVFLCSSIVGPVLVHLGVL